jgi:hypothetical protein
MMSGEASEAENIFVVPTFLILREGEGRDRAVANPMSTLGDTWVILLDGRLTGELVVSYSPASSVWHDGT